MIKTSEKNCAQRFDDSMSSFLLEVSKHHIEVITFRFERLLSGRQVERTIKHGLEWRFLVPFIDMALVVKK